MSGTIRLARREAEWLFRGAFAATSDQDVTPVICAVKLTVKDDRVTAIRDRPIPGPPAIRAVQTRGTRRRVHYEPSPSATAPAVVARVQEHVPRPGHRHYVEGP